MDDITKTWIHPATFTFSLEQPPKLMETIWSERPGWGYLRRRDLWVPSESEMEDLISRGYVLKKPLNRGDTRECPGCGMYISAVPGALVQKHIADCRGAERGWQSIEDQMIHDVRVRNFEAEMLAARLREQEELELAEKRERFERIREEQVNRQEGKDRKKRLKRETKEEFRRR